jgi:hypothetical protein
MWYNRLTAYLYISESPSMDILEEAYDRKSCLSDEVANKGDDSFINEEEQRRTVPFYTITAVSCSAWHAERHVCLWQYEKYLIFIDTEFRNLINIYILVRFAVLTAVTMNDVVFWNVTPCLLLGPYGARFQKSELIMYVLWSH